MERIAVQSKDIAVVGYDAQKLTLELTFRGGGVYHYKNVSAEVYEELMNAPSKGLFVRDRVKEKYDYEKVS